METDRWLLRGSRAGDRRGCRFCPTKRRLDGGVRPLPNRATADCVVFVRVASAVRRRLSRRR